MYNLRNKVRNLTGFDVYCAYSGPPVGGGADEWHVSILKAGYESDYVDVDYIETVEYHHYLSEVASRNGKKVNRNFLTNSWVKVRQLTTTTVRSDPSDGNIGNLTANTYVFGSPKPALDEAKRYDGLLFGEDTKGTEAVKRAIFEWEDKIIANKFTPLKQRAAR